MAIHLYTCRISKNIFPISFFQKINELWIMVNNHMLNTLLIKFFAQCRPYSPITKKNHLYASECITEYFLNWLGLLLSQDPLYKRKERIVIHRTVTWESYRNQTNKDHDWHQRLILYISQSQSYAQNNKTKFRNLSKTHSRFERNLMRVPKPWRRDIDKKWLHKHDQHQSPYEKGHMVNKSIPV